MKPTRKFHDLFVSFTLAAVLHLLIIKTSALPPGNYFFPFIGGMKQHLAPMQENQGPGHMTGDTGGAAKSLPTEEVAGDSGDAVAAMPYQRAMHSRSPGAGLTQSATAIAPLPPLVGSEKGGYRSLARHTEAPKLAPPRFSNSTIPPRPEKSLGQEVDDDAEAILLGNVFQDAIPATSGYAAMLHAEAGFLEALRDDIGDGRLDMPFASFIISAEYYHLSRAMMPLGQQPSFTLEEAISRYNQRLQRVGEGVPKEIDAYWLVMLLQRYADNKFYPGNGSGMLLDSLFHSQNDCEGGTKEILAYLQALYPALSLGSNRGMLQTTSGELIGHMQVFIGPGPGSGKIVDNDRGLIVETTRVGHDSVLPYSSGDVFPLEDFVVRYYPEIVAGTPLADRLSSGVPLGEDTANRIVGASDHPLKMSYGASSTLLAEQFYDLANIRTQRIENEFLRSNIPSCNPRIDPAKIDRTNLFSNFVAIDRKLRKSLIGHYLADLPYWDNQVMPQWRQPEFLATYDDLAGSLLDEKSDASGYLQVDAEHSVPSRSLQSHGRFLRGLRAAAEQAKNGYLGKGRQECAGRAMLDDRLLGFLFTSPVGPGVFFLPMPDERILRTDFLGAVLNDCLAVPVTDGERTLLGTLEEEMVGQQTSLRKELYDRAQLRSLVPHAEEHRLEATVSALSGVVAGTTGKDPGTFSILAKRQSPESRAEDPSVQETLAESGRTGINSGLVWDIADFLGPTQISSLFLHYGKRTDLHLTVPRAQGLVGQLVTSRGVGEMPEFLAELQKTANDRTLRLAAAIHLAKLQGRPATEISSLALAYLQSSEAFRAEDLIALLHYGLLPEDALAFIRTRAGALLARLPKLGGGIAAGNSQPEPFGELVEIVQVLQYLPDQEARATLHGGLSSSLLTDFSSKSTAGSTPKTEVDYGLLFNKLAVLALLHSQVGEERGAEPLSVGWLQQFIRFAADNPIGKLMLGPVVKIAGGEGLVAALTTLIPGQMAILERLQQPSGQLATTLREVKAVLGDGNVFVQMLLSIDADQVSRLSGLPVEELGKNPKNKAAWYLEKLHSRIGPSINVAGKASALAGNAAGQPQKSKAGTDPFLDFYLDDRVRESFAMLAYLQGEAGGNAVKFRKTQDLAAIKDPTKIQVIEGERKITRQDMSVLTLALNSGNHPSAIRRAWEETLAVTGKHLGLKSLDQGLRRYLFAPHYPYLTEDDSGFFFSPETVEDLHNAADWGGRNDILLSSYLHFRNLPGQLPDWLRRTAIARSEQELKIIKKFEQQSFLPMILECDSDKNELPDPLFRAKWAIRKPFGEDIFPGTLLLLRLGYLEITATGEIVRTAKYAGG